MVSQQITPGWATYLRVSDEDKQTPERSFAMQRHQIQQQLLTPSKVPFCREYTDLLSGTNPNRKDYQQMITDAENGKFSHIGMYRADRFGRNTVEGLQTATKLIGLGIKIRIANMPSLEPENPDGLFMFLIQMGMAQREVDVLAQRTAGGMEAKMRQGGWSNKAPEGYINKERQVGSNKYHRWVEMDPLYIQAIKDAWEMLLTDRYTLDQICEELTRRGYVRSSGRPWAWNDPQTNNRQTAKNRMHDIFYNPFYAGWVVSERFGINLGEIKGQWEPAITLDQFERGKEILRKHDHNKSRHKKIYYLLRNLLWVQVDGKQYKMYGSTPTGRSQSYSYYITHAKPNGKIIRLNTKIIDSQIEKWLSELVIDPVLHPSIQETYTKQLKKMTQDDHEKSLKQLEKRFSELKQEEARLGRLFMTGEINEDIYKQLRSEWSDKSLSVQRKIDEMKFDMSNNLNDLEVALVLITSIKELYQRMTKPEQTQLLQMFTRRIILNPQGEIIDYELLSPFKYLSTLASHIGDQDEDGGSGQVRLGDPYRTRTYNTLIKSQLLCQLS